MPHCVVAPELYPRRGKSACAPAAPLPLEPRQHVEDEVDVLLGVVGGDLEADGLVALAARPGS